MKTAQLAAACAFIVVAGAVPVMVRGQGAAPVGKGHWTQKAPMITPRSEVSLAEVGGKIYVLGGGITGTSVPHNEEYEIARRSLAHPLSDAARTRPHGRRGVERQDHHGRRLRRLGAQGRPAHGARNMIRPSTPGARSPR